MLLVSLNSHPFNTVHPFSSGVLEVDRMHHGIHCVLQGYREGLLAPPRCLCHRRWLHRGLHGEPHVPGLCVDMHLRHLSGCNTLSRDPMDDGLHSCDNCCAYGLLRRKCARGKRGTPRRCRWSTTKRRFRLWTSSGCTGNRTIPPRGWAKATTAGPSKCHLSMSHVSTEYPFDATSAVASWS
jgi:hypothetical protein